MDGPVCPRCGQAAPAGHDCTRTGAERPARDGPATDALSFTERFRGTQWDARAQAVGGPRLQPARSGGSRLLLALGLALLVAASAGVAFLAMGGGRPAPAGLPGLPVSPKPTASPSPRPPTPTPAAWRSEPGHPALKFIELMTSEDLSFHAQSEMAIRVSDGVDDVTVRASQSVDISGEEFSTQWTTENRGLRQAESVIGKDGYYYYRSGNGDWFRDRIAPLWSMFGDLRGADFDRLEYAGPVTRGNRPMHRLRLTSPPAPIMTTMLLQVGMTAPRELSWDIWVAEDGRPDSAATEFDGVSFHYGARATMTTTMVHRFTRVGQAIEIAAPARYRSR